MKRILFLFFALVFSLCAGPVYNIGIRHDREESLFKEFAKQFPAVCQVSGFASGVLIDNEWVLTAAHVVDFFDMLVPDPSQRVVSFDGKEYTIKEAVVYPGHIPITPELLSQQDKGDDFNLHDIALLQLERAVQGVKPIMIYRGMEEIGSEFVIAGYGAFFNDPENGIAPELLGTLLQGTKRAGMNRFDREGTRIWTLEAIFDPPGEGALDLEAFPFVGDSGGPILIKAEGEWKVAGIVSFMEDDEDYIGRYGSTFTAARVSKYASWIEETIFGIR